jgi:hypothetical protein
MVLLLNELFYLSATTATQTVLLCKHASKPSDALDYDTTIDKTMFC